MTKSVILAMGFAVLIGSAMSPYISGYLKEGKHEGDLGGAISVKLPLQ